MGMGMGLTHKHTHITKYTHDYTDVCKFKTGLIDSNEDYDDDDDDVGLR